LAFAAAGAKTQIPFGNDKQKGEWKCKLRYGMEMQKG